MIDIYRKNSVFVNNSTKNFRYMFYKGGNVGHNDNFTETYRLGSII